MLDKKHLVQKEFSSKNLDPKTILVKKKCTRIIWGKKFGEKNIVQKVWVKKSLIQKVLV